jgi:uncharacterized membrane protein YfcA
LPLIISPTNRGRPDGKAPVMNAGLFMLLSAAVFIGAFVSGLAGFAFSAAAGAILLHILPPLEAVPLMMACSIGVQATNLWALRHTIRWTDSMGLIVGGLLGIPIAVWLLHTVDTTTFRIAFGSVVAIYAIYMLLRPNTAAPQQMNHGRNALVGFGGGLIGGLTAMPGALPTIWCDMHGLPKNEQRALVQPFIAVMQLAALLVLFSRQDVSSRVLIDFALSVPALLAGSVLGVIAFRHLNDREFRRIILVLLLVSGALLAL